MKKGKLSLVFYFATLCLSITALVFGVYSVKQAKLSISGSVGFSAHQCKAEIVGTITGASDSIDGEAKTLYVSSGDKVSTTSETIAFTGSSSNETKNATYDGIFFTYDSETDEPQAIIMSFAIKNTSKFKIQANIDVSSLTLSNVNTPSITNNDAIIAVEGSQTITVTFTLVEDKDTALAISGSMSLELTKYQEIQLNEYVISNDTQSSALDIASLKTQGYNCLTVNNGYTFEIDEALTLENFVIKIDNGKINGTMTMGKNSYILCENSCEIDSSALVMTKDANKPMFVINGEYAFLTMKNCTITQNSESSEIFNLDNGSLTLFGCTFNTTTSAKYIVAKNGSTIAINGCESITQDKIDRDSSSTIVVDGNPI